MTQESQIEAQNSGHGALDLIGEIEARFGALGKEIIEQLYVNEVIESLDLCFGLADDRNKVYSGRASH